jgi:hypothetical protein
MLVSVALASPLPAGEALDWPLEAGNRWTFTDARGEERLVLDALGGGRVEVRGPSVFWGSSGFTLRRAGDDWLLTATESYLGPDEKPAPWLVVDGPLRAGRRWEVVEERDGVPFTFSVEVVGSEPLPLPDGPVRAWHLRYRLLSHLGTERDVDLWFADGLGLVKLAQVAESTLGEKRPPDAPVVATLARFERRGTAVAVGDAPDDALRAEVVATGPGRVGERLPLGFSVVNAGPVAVDAIPSLDASDVGWRYPKIGIEIVDPDGTVVEPGDLGRCGMTNPLADALAFVPDRPGGWRVRFTYDTSGADGWGPLDPDVAARIAGVPAGVYRAETVVTVLP